MLWFIVPVALFLFGEITFLIWVSSYLQWWTLGLLLATTVAGAWLLQREGRRTWNALSKSLSIGSLPPGQTADAILVLVGGVLLISPGFLSDIVGLLLLLPLTRPLIRMSLGKLFSRAIARGGTQPTVISGEVVDERSPEPQVPEMPPKRDEENP